MQPTKIAPPGAAEFRVLIFGADGIVIGYQTKSSQSGAQNLIKCYSRKQSQKRRPLKGRMAIQNARTGTVLTLQQMNKTRHQLEIGSALNGTPGFYDALPIFTPRHRRA